MLKKEVENQLVVVRCMAINVKPVFVKLFTPGVNTTNNENQQAVQFYLEVTNFLDKLPFPKK